MKDTITIICPLYNAENYIRELDRNIRKQKNVVLTEIRYIVTESTDQTEEILESQGISYEHIKREDFSHSLTREKAAMTCNTDIVVFITQDIIIQNENWLHELVKPIISGEAEASFARQLCKDNSIEKYTRELNYPSQSRIVSKSDIEQLGLNAFFFSDVSSAVRKDIFVELNGYDNKKMGFNEDMYFAHKLLMSGYRIKYCAESEVVHSHTFSFKQQFERYRLSGAFFKENTFMDQYGTNKAGGNMAKHVLKRAIGERNWKVILHFVPNMAARFLGMKVGRYFG